MAITYVPQVTTIVEAPGLLQMKPVTFPQGQLQLDKKTSHANRVKPVALGIATTRQRQATDKS